MKQLSEKIQFCFSVSPGSAEILFSGGGKINYLLNVQLLGNVSAKKCKIRTMVTLVISENVENHFWDTVYLVTYCHGPRASASTVLTATGLVNRRRRFSTLTESTGDITQHYVDIQTTWS